MARKKTFTVSRFSPLTDTQMAAEESWRDDVNLVLLGYAGTGKTHVAVSLALNEVAAGRADGLIFVRSAVPTRNQGFLPGDSQEKLQEYEAAYAGIVNSIVHVPGTPSAWNHLIREKVISFESTSYLRGVNWDNKIVILDEMQNCTFHELDTVLTRVGEGTRIIFSGDRVQSDLTYHEKQEKMTLDGFITIVESMSEFFDVIRFGANDIVRSDLVKEYILERTRLFPDL